MYTVCHTDCVMQVQTNSELLLLAGAVFSVEDAVQPVYVYTCAHAQNMNTQYNFYDCNVQNFILFCTFHY